MIAFIFALAALIASLSLACHIFGRAAVGAVLRTVYRETKHVIGTTVRRGWRPSIPWCFVALLIVIVVRLALGLPLPDMGTLTVLLGPLGAIAAHAVQVRSGDYRAGVANAPPAPSGGLVNNAALA